MAPTQTIHELSDVQRAILATVKRLGPSTTAELASALDISYEAVRLPLARLRGQGWLEREAGRRAGERRVAGRPRARYRLTVAGEHAFPKAYDALSIELIDAVLARAGRAGLRRLLADLTEARVRRWAPALEGLSLEQKLERLRDVYLEGDPFTRVERGTAGEDPRLIEHNCPFLNVATARPALCSLTVSTLSRLLGCRVVREHRFQDGDGRCAFRVLADQPLPADAPTFEFEP